MTKRCGIYCLIHIASKRKYIGQSIDIDERLRGHANGRSGRGVLAHAIRKYGADAFESSVLVLCDVGSLDPMEVHFIKELGTLHPAGFNLTTGGRRQYQVTDTARAIISVTTRAALSNPEIRAKLSAAQSCRSEELLAYIRRRQIEAWTPEKRAAMSDRMRGVSKSDEWKAAVRGIPKSAEWKAAMSVRQSQPDAIARLRFMVNNQSAETREKIASSKRGLILSAETKAKISASKKGTNTGRVWSEEMRSQQSATCKAGWARRRERLAAERLNGLAAK